MRAHAKWIVAGVLAGIAIGWWLGAWTTCGAHCGFNVALFEAIGTWVGGVGVASVAAGYAWVRTRRDREAALVAAENEALALARDCAIRFTPRGDEHNGYRSVHIEFENKLSERVYDVKLVTADDEPLRVDAQVRPGRAWGATARLDALRLEEHYPTEADVRTALRREGKRRVIFIFTIRGFVFERIGNVVSITRRPDRPHGPGEQSVDGP